MTPLQSAGLAKAVGGRGIWDLKLLEPTVLRNANTYRPGPCAAACKSLHHLFGTVDVVNGILYTWRRQDPINHAS